MKIKSTFFKRKMDWDGTLVPGYWIPILCRPTNIGDHFTIDVSDEINALARLAPLKGYESLRIAGFHVQNKDIWKGWWDFRTGGPDNMDTSKIPYMLHSHAKGDVGFNTLTDYLQTAPALTFYTESGGTFTPNSQVGRARCLAERAYAKIGQDYLMRQGVETESDYPLSTDGAENGEDLVTNRQLFPCHWNRDYFTNMQSSQIRGAQVTIPIGTEAPVIGSGVSLGLTNGINFAAAVSQSGGGNSGCINLNSTNYGAAVGTVGGVSGAFADGKTVGVTTDPEKSGLIAKLDGVSGFSLRTLNLAVAVEKIGNFLMMHGSRPVEFMNTFFGVKSSDARMDRAIFLGSYSTDFITMPVTQTSSTDAVTPQGHQAGQSYHAARYPRFKCYCEEDGWIMILACIRQKTNYCQGLPAYHNYESRYDYPNPVFQHLDYVAAKNSEIMYTGITNGTDSSNWDDESLQDNQKFALHPIFQEWRSFQSETHGDLLGSLRYWTNTRIFANLPQFNKAFINVGNTYSYRNFSVLSGAPYIAHFHYDIKLKRKLAKFGTPKYFGVFK